MQGKRTFIEQQYAFAAHIRDPERHELPAGVENRRMAIYRELFYNNVEGFLANGFPVLRRLLDERRWHALARDFFASHRCHSPLFAEIPREFLDYLEQERGEREDDPPFLHELAHYEWVELALSLAETEAPSDVDPDGELIEGAPVPSPLAWLLAYRYPVHRIGPDFIPSQPGEQMTYLLVYRDARDDIGFLELNPVTARLFALLHEQPGVTGRQALQTISEELRHPDPEVVLQGGRQILEQWRQVGVVLGRRS